MIAAIAIAALGVAIALLFNDLIRIIHDLIAGLVKVLGMIFYILSYVFFLIIDFLEITFKRVIGLKGTYSINIDGTRTTSGDDLVLTVIKSQTVQNIFWSLSIIAIFLLVVSVIIAIIRSEYSWDKQGNSKGPIFGKALKAIALYFTIPVACVFGVWGASQLLKALDQATSGGSETYISSMVFSASATTGNRLQSGSMWEILKKEYSDAGGDLSKTAYCARFCAFAEAGYGGASHSDVVTALSGTDSQQVAAARAKIQKSIDEAFRASYGVDLTNGEGSSKNFGYTYNAKSSSDAYKFSSSNEDYDVLWLIRKSVPEAGVSYVCSPYDINTVYFYYGLVPAAGGVGWGYNHILSILCSFLILKVLFDITCGVLKRAYELVVLYVISPPVVAIMPLDDGSAYKGWVKAFISKTLMAYGGVLAINFFFMLVPIFNTISIFTTTNGLTGAQQLFFGGSWISGFFDMLVRLLFVLAGAFSISSLSKMISGIIGAEDAAENGSAISGAVGGMTGKLIGMGVGVFGKAAKFGIGKVAGAVDKNKQKKQAEKDAKEMQDIGDRVKDGTATDSEIEKWNQHQNEQAEKKEMSEIQQKMQDGSASASEIKKFREYQEKQNAKNSSAASAGGGASGGGSGGDSASGSSGGSGGGSSGKLTDYLSSKGHKGLAGGLGLLGSVAKLYGSALNNATGGELKKGFDSGYKTGETVAGQVGAVVGSVGKLVGKGVVKGAKAVGKGIWKADKAIYDKIGITEAVLDQRASNAKAAADVQQTKVDEAGRETRKLYSRMRRAKTADEKAHAKQVWEESKEKLKAEKDKLKTLQEKQSKREASLQGFQDEQKAAEDAKAHTKAVNERAKRIAEVRKEHEKTGANEYNRRYSKKQKKENLRKFVESGHKK